MPGSDLRHVAGSASQVDVLIARRDPPAPVPDGPGGPDAWTDEADDDDDEEFPPATVPVDGSGWAGRGEETARSGTGGSKVRLHRLGLRSALRERDEPDLVAAMSELVGFDPDEHVFCLAPTTGPETLGDPELAVLARAVRRVATVYGLPVLHYRPVSGDGGLEITPAV